MPKRPKPVSVTEPAASPETEPPRTEPLQVPEQGVAMTTPVEMPNEPLSEVHGDASTPDVAPAPVPGPTVPVTPTSPTTAPMPLRHPAAVPRPPQPLLPQPAKASVATLDSFFQPIRESEQFVAICVYGASGSGKTTWAATSQRPVFADLEGGSKVVAHTEAHVHHVTGVADLRLTLQVLRDALSGGNCPYQTLIVDTVTELQGKGLQERLTASANNPLDPQDLYDVDIGDYGFNSQQVRQLIREIRALPMHKVFICQEDVETNPMATVQVRPLVSRKVGEDLMQGMDAVLHLTQADDGTRTVHTAQHRGAIAKTRIELIRNRSWPRAFQLMANPETGAVSPSVEWVMNYLLNRTDDMPEFARTETEPAATGGPKKLR